MAVAPCGISYTRVLQIIKDKVITGNYNGRKEVMEGLMSDGLSYSEATAVTDMYYQIYRRLSRDSKVSKPTVLLTSKEKLQKRLNNVAVDYLNGELQGFPMTDADVANLEAIYEKMAKADTPTLKEKYNEEASVFVQKFLPNYSKELFKSFVYNKPLLSPIFFIKTLLSNGYQQLERSLTNSLWDGKKVDLTKLGKFSGLAKAQFKNVLRGGVPATSLYQSESNTGTNTGRLEEFDTKGSDVESSKLKSAYFNLINFYTRWSARANAAPDTRGIFASAERHFYQLLKEKFRDLGLKEDEVNQKVLEMMELKDVKVATDMAEAKFKELGLPTKSSNGKNTKEFNVAVEEYRRLSREETLWAKAVQLGKDDFWKRNMLVASELGFGDYGIFGFKAQMLGKLRNHLQGGKKSNLKSAFNLYAFGFLNGASNFAEDSLERMPLYGIAKALILQRRKGKVTDQQLINDISRRQRDIVVKNITTAMTFVIYELITDIFCDEGETNTSRISSGKTQIGPCGIPVVVPPQMMPVYKMYKILVEGRKKDEDWGSLALKTLPVLSQENTLGLSGAIDKFGNSITNIGIASAQGNEVRVAEEKDKLVNNIIRMGADYGNSFIPLPSRIMNEVGVVAQRVQGMGQKQMQLPFAIDEVGDKKGAFETLEKVSLASLGNVTGINELIVAAVGAKKNYAVDWMGRKVVQFRGSDITGSGIQYTKSDDILATVGVQTPYVSRMEKVEIGKDAKERTIFGGKELKVTNKTVRYLTDEEYFNVSLALGNFNKKFFEDNEKGIIKLVKEDKKVAAKVFKSIFTSAKKAAISAVADGKNDPKIIQRIVANKIKDIKTFRTTETGLNEEDE